VDPALAVRTWLLKTEPLDLGPDAAYRIRLMDSNGDEIADGVGSDLVSGLLDVIRHMLPPENPDYLPPQS
jgi:hypothetical protein